MGWNPYNDYITKLYDFKKDYENFKVLMFTKFFEEKKIEYCKIAFHNLKNFSSLIGSKKIYNLSNKLQKKCSVEKDIKEAEILMLILDLCDLLEELIDQLNQYLPKLEQKHIHNDSVNILDHLKLLIEDHNYNEC